VFSEKCREASSFASVEDNLRLMAKELDSRREIIAAARQIRNDRRIRREKLADLLRQGKVQETLDYLQQLSEDEAILPQESVWCENETVNALLSGYSRKANAAGLRFSAMASIIDRGTLPEIEIVEMVSNLMEVAFKTADARGDVTCLVRQRSDSLGVTVSNSVKAGFTLNTEGLPLPGNDENLSSALGLAHKCRGECHYRLERGLLTCESILSVA